MYLFTLWVGYVDKNKLSICEEHGLQWIDMQRDYDRNEIKP